MNIRTLSVLALLTTSVVAQGNLYSPPWLAKQEGSQYSYYLGYYANQRFQMGDGELRGAKRSISQVAFRLDNREYTTTNARGRSWTNVVIKAGETDTANFDRTFANNRKSAQTQVYSNKVSWPTFVGKPLVSPSVWGGLKSEYRFPFSNNYAYSGAKDLLLEFEFNGGKLSNGSTSTNLGTYYLDGYGSPTGSVGSMSTYVPAKRLNNNSAGVTGRCNDSAMTTTTGAYVYSYFSLYGAQYSITNWRNQVRWYHYSYYTAYNAPVIHAISFGVDEKGVDLGTGCNKLHLKGPMVFVPRVTYAKNINSSGYTPYSYNLIPWNNAMANATVGIQAAWNDSKTGKFNLTGARKNVMPASAPPATLAKRAALHSSSQTATTGSLYNATSFFGNPAACYTYK